MRLTALALATSLVLAGCGGPVLSAARATGGTFGAAAAKKPGKAAGGRQDVGKLVTKKPASPLARNVALTFAVLDEDADGAIAAAEWPYDAAAVSRGAVPHQTPDKDRDGRVSEAEWTAFATARFKDAPFAAVDVADGFVRVDLDASEKLTADEVGLFVGGLPARVRASLYLDTETISAWVKAGDANRDFALDLAELERLVAQLMIKRFGDVD